MKRFFLMGFVFVTAGILSGCPIYDNHGDGDCHMGNCDPDPPGPVPGCTSSADCGINETCGSDDQCHVGSCTIWGCSGGLECVVNNDQTADCKPPGGNSTSSSGGSSSSGGMGGAGSGGGGTGGSGTGGAAPGPVYCGNPGDCAAGETCTPNGTCQAGDCSMLGCIFGYFCDQNLTCQPSNPAACGQDEDCGGFGAGYLCISGVCTAAVDQCSDQTQCLSGQKCADGKCVTSCVVNAECPAGYLCDTNIGLCLNAATPCVVTNDCGSADSVCVDGACVPRSSGATCDPGRVWVENGCVPDQAAVFFCNAEGQQDNCQAGSICLHHNCYLSCEMPNDNACNNLPVFNVCKPVATGTGTYKVCGSNQNLGMDCDPTLGKACSMPGQVCLDGFCL